MLGPPTNTLGSFPLGITADIENYIYAKLFIIMLLVTAKTENKCLITEDWFTTIQYANTNDYYAPRETPKEKNINE